jgi:hypothetical protein
MKKYNIFFQKIKYFLKFQIKIKNCFLSFFIDFYKNKKIKKIKFNYLY